MRSGVYFHVVGFLILFCNPFCPETYHKVPQVGDKSERLSEDQYRIGPENTVCYYGGGTHKADYPESRRQHGFFPPDGIYPLVHETESEDDLPGGAEYQKSRRHILVEYEPVEEFCIVHQHEKRRDKRSQDKDDLQRKDEFLPKALQLQVPKMR